MISSNSPKPIRLGLTGYPLGHSLSPVLHEAALRAAGLPGEYRLYPLSPHEVSQGTLRGLIERVRAGELRGLNVTIPHKQAVISLMDLLSSTARAVGAVNTLYLNSQGQLTGDNTDVPGFLRDVRLLVGQKVGSALVLGAGGSARAVIYGLGQAGWNVNVLARRPEQAQSLVQEVAGKLERKEGIYLAAGELPEDGEMQPSPAMERLAADAEACDLLVNTTPLGMTPHPDGCPWPENLPLPNHAAVYDLVYNPAETVLVRRARAVGLPARTGLGMLVAQAALAFHIWTGIEPPYDTMSQAAEQAMRLPHPDHFTQTRKL